MSRAASKGRSAGGFIAAAALLLATAFVGPADAQETGDGLIPEGDWTDQQVQDMVDLIDLVETELPATYPASGPRADIEADLGARGYHNFGVPSDGYWHMINPVYVQDEIMIDPTMAESLVYQDVGGGNWELVSAMFIAGPNDTVDDLPDDIAWYPGWHGHPELCNNPDGTFNTIIDPETEECPEGLVQATTPIMMHVWIVDGYGCDHRFGGVGVGGVHCDHMGHDPDDHDPDDHDPDDHDPDDHDPDDHDDDHDDHGDDSPPPAQPVTGIPSFTG